jgi:hypothetical protein
MNPVSKAKSEVSSALGFVKSHPIAAVLFGMVFGAFLFPILARFLGNLKARGGIAAKVIPGAFTRV